MLKGLPKLENATPSDASAASKDKGREKEVSHFTDGGKADKASHRRPLSASSAMHETASLCFPPATAWLDGPEGPNYLLYDQVFGVIEAGILRTWRDADAKEKHKPRPKGWRPPPVRNQPT